MRFVVNPDNWQNCRFEVVWHGRSFPSVSANLSPIVKLGISFGDGTKRNVWWDVSQKNPTIVDLKTVFKIIGCWKEDRSSKLSAVSVWCGLARSLLPMVLRHPIAKCQALKIAWWWHKMQTLMFLFQKERFQTMLLWRLFVTSLVVLRGTAPRGVSLTRLGKVTPSDGFGRPSRQMSEFENGLVVPENATSEQLRELPLRSSLRVTPSHGFLQTCRQLSNLEYPLVMAPNAMSGEMFPKKIQPLLIWKRFSKSLAVEKKIAPRNLVRCLSDAAWQGHSFRWFYDTPSPNVKLWKSLGDDTKCKLSCFFFKKSGSKQCCSEDCL